MIGWRVARKCFVAWRFGVSSQQPTWPQVRQSRRCSHSEPIFRHSSQPSALGVTSRMSAAWAHSSDIMIPRWLAPRQKRLFDVAQAVFAEIDLAVDKEGWRSEGAALDRAPRVVEEP